MDMQVAAAGCGRDGAENVDRELPTTSATIAAFPEGGGAAILAPRMLEPGHFVASIDAVAGQLTVDILSPVPAASGGGNLHVHVTIEVSS